MEEENKRDNIFTISITGSNANFEVPINSMDDFRNLDDILRILKKKLS